MGKTLGTEHRIHREIGLIIERQTGLDYSPELDFRSPTMNLPKIAGNPIFNVLIERYKDKTTLPVSQLRIEIMFMGETSQGEQTDELFQDLLTNFAKVEKILLIPSTWKKLGMMKLTSNGFINRINRNFIEIEATFTGVAIQRNGEYKL